MASTGLADFEASRLVAKMEEMIKKYFEDPV